MPQPSPTRPSRGTGGSTAAAALRAVLSLAVLLVLLIALPLLLWWATAIVGPDGARALGHLLSTQDSGQVFLLALAAVGWAGWVMFAVSVLMEIPAQLRGRTAPQLKGLLGQRTAATLVGALFLILPAGTALASATAPAQAATPAAAAAAHPGGAAHGAVTATQAAASRGTARTPGPVSYTVQETRPAQSLWSIAEQQLGDGNRWTEIADLNAGATMTDGTAFHADAPIQPGWVLHLPADARAHQGTAPDTAHESPVARPDTYTVAPGDSLSGIAEQQLGDAAQWPQIYELNQGQPQPGGGHLDDPDLIYPREKLQLPAPDHAGEAADPRPGPGPHPAPPHHALTPAPAPSPPATTAPASPAPAATGQDQAPAPQPSAPAPATTTPPTTTAPVPSTSTPPATASSSAPSGSATAAHATQTGSRMPLYALGGGLLAAAVLTMLGLRRRHQQRRRGIGRRIPLPKGSAAATEQALRATEQPDAPELIDRALRTAAVHLAAAGRELPDLAAAVYGPTGLELHLTEPAAPVPPFTAASGGLDRWLCPPDSGELLDAARTDAIESPYPALVTLGATANGSTVLIDLEHHPMVILTGTGRRAVLRALAIELATSRYAEQLEVAVAGTTTCPGLAPLVPEWFTEYDDPEAAVIAARTHHAAQAQALAALGVAGLRQARLRDDQASSWTPHLVLADDADAAVAEALAAFAGLRPRTAGTVVTSAGGTPASLPEGGWLVDTTSGHVRLPDTDLTVTLQALPDDAYADVVQLLAESDEARPDVSAAPSPDTRPAGGPADPVVAATALPEATIPVAWEAAAGTHSPKADDTAHADAGLLAGLADLEEDDADGAGAKGEPGTPAAAEPAPEGKAVPVPEARLEKEITPSDPLIRILGPVDVAGAKGTADTKYLRTVTEIAAWMVTHPGLDHHALDEAIWPGRDVSRKTRNPWISRLRSMLGTAVDGTKYLPAIATTDDARYRFADQVTSDWHLFQELAAKGATSSGDHADDQLRAALDLVRGRPFSGIPPRRYVWAEHLAQDMIAAIVDVAAALGERRLALADPRGALWATTKGLEVAPEAEHLYRINFRAHHALGDQEGLERAAGQLERLCDALGSDMEDATVELLRSLLAAAAPLR